MQTRNTETYGSSEYVPTNLLALFLKVFGAKNVQLWLANKHACPIPDEVAQDYGLEKSIHRYNKCNRVSKKIWSIAQRMNPDLYIELTSWNTRSPGEPVGKHEKLHVPEIHLTELSPLTPPTGYALARVVICMMDALKKKRREPDYLWRIVQNCVKESQTAEELLARLSDYALKQGVSPVEILQHVFAEGVMEEENTAHRFYTLSIAMNAYALQLMKVYSAMWTPEKRNNGILIAIPRPTYLRT